MALPPVVGLEFGSSKVIALVGEMREDGHVMITGMGEQPSVGVRKGEVIDLARSAECARAAVERAEESADVTIREVTLAVSGGHIRALVNRGLVPVMDRERGIGREDVEQVMEIARAVSLPPEREVLHTICQHFWVDDLQRVASPEGMDGSKLSLDMLIIHGLRNALRNAVKAVQAIPLEVQDVAFGGLCAALAVLTPDQKKRGVAVLDLGAGTTDYVAYGDGVMTAAGALGVGGEHVTNDVAVAFQISLEQAEKLKRDHGSARIEGSNAGQRVTTQPEVGFPARSLSLTALHTVIHARMEELFYLVRRELEKAHALHRLGAGIVLTGGGAHLRGVCELAREVFGVNASISKPRNLSGLTLATEGPEYAACAGAIQYGYRTMTEEQSSPWWHRWMRHLLRR